MNEEREKREEKEKERGEGETGEGREREQDTNSGAMGRASRVKEQPRKDGHDEANFYPWSDIV